jgi:hypothetical protein
LADSGLFNGLRAQLQGASLLHAKLRATDLSRAFLWRSNAAPKTEDLRLESLSWAPSWQDERGERQAWSNETYSNLKKAMGAIPESLTRDAALGRIRVLDCVNPDKTLASCDPDAAASSPPKEASDWRQALESAGTKDEATYRRALARVLQTLVCSGDGNSLYVLRGLTENSLSASGGALARAGAEAPKLVDGIMSPTCPVSANLTDDDRAGLLEIKQEAIESTKAARDSAPSEMPHSP